MQFDLTDEQRQLDDALTRLLSQHYAFTQRRAIAAEAQGFSLTVWQHLAEMGVTGLGIAPAHGGISQQAADWFPALRAGGRVLALEPLFASSILGATAVAQADPAFASTCLPEVASGQRQLAFAIDEPETRHAPCWVQTRATPSADGWRLHGVKQTVLQGASADQLIVVARCHGAPDAPAGVALFWVDAHAPGLTLRRHRLVDDTPAAHLTLDDVPARALGNPEDAATATAALDRTVRTGMAALCVDMLGAMEAAFQLTTDYLNTRQQFGRRLGENQALRHRMAEMLVSLEMARSMAIAAVVALDHPDGEQSGRDIARAKLVVGRHARLLCQHAIQLHGGIGMAEEYAVGHYLRRVHVRDHLFGDPGSQAQRLAAD